METRAGKSRYSGSGRIRHKKRFMHLSVISVKGGHYIIDKKAPEESKPPEPDNIEDAKGKNYGCSNFSVNCIQILAIPGIIVAFCILGLRIYEDINRTSNKIRYNYFLNQNKILKWTIFPFRCLFLNICPGISTDKNKMKDNCTNWISSITTRIFLPIVIGFFGFSLYWANNVAGSCCCSNEEHGCCTINYADIWQDSELINWQNSQKSSNPDVFHYYNVDDDDDDDEFNEISKRRCLESTVLLLITITLFLPNVFLCYKDMNKPLE